MDSGWAQMLHGSILIVKNDLLCPMLVFWIRFYEVERPFTAILDRELPDSSSLWSQDPLPGKFHLWEKLYLSSSLSKPLSTDQAQLSFPERLNPLLLI